MSEGYYWRLSKTVSGCFILHVVFYSWSLPNCRNY